MTAPTKPYLTIARNMDLPCLCTGRDCPCVRQVATALADNARPLLRRINDLRWALSCIVVGGTEKTAKQYAEDALADDGLTT